MNAAARAAAEARSKAYEAATSARVAGKFRDEGDDRREANYRNRAVKGGGRVVESVDRNRVWDRDKGVCALCGQRANRRAWHLEHLYPLSRGGDHSYANTAVSHPHCNLSKGSKTLDEWRTFQASKEAPLDA